MASSHAFALMPPSTWDDFRFANRQRYGSRFGDLPPENPRVQLEPDAEICERYQHISKGLGYLRDAVVRLAPEAIVIIADDQNENLTSANLPQVAIYTGGDFQTRSGGKTIVPRTAHPRLATAIHQTCVEADIDMTSLQSFQEDLLFAHAFGPLLDAIDPAGTRAVVPIFLNAIHVPAPSPQRCYYIGTVVRQAIEAFAPLESAVLCASGGLSHFSAGYPYEHYDGPYGYGSIAEDFDRRIVGMMANGDAAALGALTSKELLDNGEIELRAWIALLGAIGDGVRPELLVYEPFYRGIMGMGVAFWDLANTQTTVRGP